MFLPTYAEPRTDVKFMATVNVKGQPMDVYLAPDDMGFDGITVRHGNEEWEYSSFPMFALIDNFIGTPTQQVAKAFYKLSTTIVGEYEIIA